MDFSNISIFSLMRSKLNYLSERHSVLAQNVANADTPGYKAKDVETPDFQNMLKKMSQPAARNLPIHMTNEHHMGPKAPSAAYKIEKREHTYELNPDGNNVAIEEEMMKIAQNQGEYQKVLNLYRKSVEMFKTAIGRPNGGV